MEYLLKGLLIGFSIAAPVGPIGLLCIKRTLNHGRFSGLVSGLGAATADAMYGIIAGFGLTIISSFFVNNIFVFRLIGGLFLCYLGYKTFISKPAAESAKITHKGLLSDYTSILFLTITNPMTILSFVAIFAGLGIGASANTPWSAVTLVSGVFLGSASWWLLLSTLVSLFRSKLSVTHLNLINKLSGLIIMGFGVIALIGLVTK